MLRCLSAIFVIDPVRASLAHGTLSNMLQDRLKGSCAAEGTVLEGVLEALALHATRCAALIPRSHRLPAVGLSRCASRQRQLSPW